MTFCRLRFDHPATPTAPPRNTWTAVKRAPFVILLVIVVLVGGGATWYFALGGKATLTDASAKGGPTPTATVSASE